MRNNCQGCGFNYISTYGSISVWAYGYLSTPQIAGLHKMKRKSVYTSKPSHLMSFLVASRWQITQHMARTGVNTRKSSICRFCTFLKVVLQVDESTGDCRELNTRRYKAQSDSSLFGAFSSADSNCGFAQCWSWGKGCVTGDLISTCCFLADRHINADWVPFTCCA